MAKLAIIGGTGLNQLLGLDRVHTETLETPYGEPSAPVAMGMLGGREVMFLARHGQPHRIAPHLINYRANVWALHRLGARQIIAVNAVGGIAETAADGSIWLPDQLIDYTSGRVASYSEEEAVKHIDFSYPLSQHLRGELSRAAERAGLEAISGGVYGVTQGPRLETAAEIERMSRDGCDLVGMTLMPEACLARELDLEYACVSLVVNKAAGRSGAIITMDDIQRNIDEGMGKVRALISSYVLGLPVN